MKSFIGIIKDVIARSVFFDNSTNGFVSDNVQDAIEESKSAVSAGFNFGRSGNVSNNTWLLRPGSVPSNRSGINLNVDGPSLENISVGSETLDTYTVEVYQHDGNSTNLTLIASASVVASRKEVLVAGTDFTIVNPLQKDRHVAIKIVSGSAKNLGVDLKITGS